jgi:hypothetical protein
VGIPGAGDAHEGPGRSESGRMKPGPHPWVAPWRSRRSRTVPPGGVLRAAPVADTVLDELGAEAIGWPGWAAVPGDSTARPVPPHEPGAGLAGLATTLIVPGSRGHRARFRGVTSRPAGRPRYRKDPGFSAGS